MIKKEVVYIGDSYTDWEMARAAEIDFIAIKNIFTDKIEDPYLIRIKSLQNLIKLLFT